MRLCPTASSCPPLLSSHSCLFLWDVADAARLQRHFESVFGAPLLAPKGAFAMLEFAEREFIGKLKVWYPNNIACSAKLDLHKDSMDTGKAGTSVSEILSCHSMPSSFLRLVVWRGFIFVACHWYTHSDRAEWWVPPLCRPWSLSPRWFLFCATHSCGVCQGSTFHGESGVDLVVDDNCAGKSTAKICELVH